MRLPVTILSDLHLGHAVSRITNVEAFRELVRGNGTVILNGDTYQELSDAFREKSSRMLEEFRTLCEEEGVDLVFISGNHDPSWDGSGWVELAGGRILITHGDALYFDGAPWSREAMERQELIRDLWVQHVQAEGNANERLKLAREIARNLRPKSYPKGRKIWQRVWEAIHPPKRAWNIIRVWWDQMNAADRFCNQYFPKSEVCLIGHFHRFGFWRAGKRVVLNTGAYLSPCYSGCVTYDGDSLVFYRIEESQPSYQKGNALICLRW